MKGLIWPTAVDRNGYPKTVEELQVAILNAFNVLNQDQDEINRACLSFKGRAAECVSANGGIFERFL